jgi:hypothetical protein
MYLYYNRDHIADMDQLTVCDHIEAKLIAVPKDSRGPRLICVHPAEAIWIQQGLWHELDRCISTHWRRKFESSPQGKIRFTDQSVNGTIALLSSASRRYATIDLAEASDRMSDVLVQDLFGSKYKYFGCCRAQKYYSSEHSLFKNLREDLYCYAPMGNATTFPIQSLVFWSICVASMQSHGFHQPTAAFVFGDDIEVPTIMAEKVCEDLEAFGLRVNWNKSFWRSHFRESCGVDAYYGIDVTPVRWKAKPDTVGLLDMQSLSDLAMRLRIAGYEEAAATAYSILTRRLRIITRDRRIWRGKPIDGLSFTNNRNHGGICEYTDNFIYAGRDAYWHKDLHIDVSPVLRIKEREPQLGPLRGWYHVLESLTSLERKAHSNVPSRHVSRRVELNRGWIPFHKPWNGPLE